jgi:hypothetical protein
MAALRLRCGADACAAHAIDAGARFVRAGVVEIGGGEFAGGTATIDASEEECGGGFEDGERGALEEIGEADEDGFFAAADGESQRGVRIEVDVETRWAAFTVEAGVDALEEGCAAGDSGWEFGHWLGTVYEWAVVRSKRARIYGAAVEVANRKTTLAFAIAGTSM